VIQRFREIKTGEGYSQKQPASIAAAAIYLATQILDKKDIANISQISAVSGMVDQTIRTSYSDMLPYAQKLLPEAYHDRIALLSGIEKKNVAFLPSATIIPPAAVPTTAIKTEAVEIEEKKKEVVPPPSIKMEQEEIKEEKVATEVAAATTAPLAAAVE